MIATTSAYAPRSLAFWKAYAVQMRPYLLFVSGVTGMAGLALAQDASTLRLLLLSLVFFGTYGFGQALTDCFQMDTDAISASYRPLVRGELRRTDVMVVSVIGLIASSSALALSHLSTLPIAALCVFGLATYTTFKRRWWAGPLYNAWIVCGLFGIAVLAGSPDSNALIRLADRSVLLSAAVVLCAYANFVLSGYFKDVYADRIAGYVTMPVRFGPKVSALVSDALALLAIAFAVLAVAGGETPAIGFIAAGALTSAVAQFRLHKVSEDDEAHRAISVVVHAYILLLAGIAVNYRPSWTLLLLLYYSVFAAALRARPVRSQI